MDGLGTMPAIGDTAFTSLSGRDQDYSAYYKLDGTFALHPALKHIHGLYREGAASFVPAMAGPYRTRSHFDAQDLLEFGMDKKSNLRSGWLARLANQTKGHGETAVALSQSLPISLQGTDKALAWAPARLNGAGDDTLTRLANLYEYYPQMAQALQTAINSENIASGMDGNSMRMRAGASKKSFVQLASAAGRFLTTDGGPTLAVMELGGWDTHNQQNRRLSQQLSILDAGIEALHTALGDEWENTCVVIASEFGRTSNYNGTGGTDHGTGGTGILLGGAVKGGTIVGDWPGLRNSDLFEGRDLMPANNTYALLGGVLRDHLGFSAKQIHSQLLPGLKDVLFSGLV